MRQQREGAIRQVLRSLQVSLAALFCGQREGSASAAGVVFPQPFFRPAPSQNSHIVFQGGTNEHRHNPSYYSHLSVSGRVAYMGAQQQLGVRTQRRHRADCYHSDSPAPTREAVSDHRDIRGTFAIRHKHAQLASPRRDSQIWDYQRISGNAMATRARHHRLQLECAHRVHRPQAGRRFTRFDLVGRGTTDARALQSALGQTERRAPPKLSYEIRLPLMVAASWKTDSATANTTAAPIGSVA